MEEEIVETLFNLILDESLTNEERSVLVYHKNKLATKGDNQKAICDLIESIRLLSVANISKSKTLSPNLAEFYKKFSSYREFEKNLGRGIISMGIIR